MIRYVVCTREEEHAELESLQRNRISNVAFAVCSTGEILVLVVMVGILKALKSDESSSRNTRAFSVLIAFSGGVWRRCLILLLKCDIFKSFPQSFVLYPGSSWRNADPD